MPCNDIIYIKRQLTDSGKDIKEVLAENKNLKRSMDKLLSESRTDSNQKLLKSFNEKLDQKLEKLDEKMDQIFEACNSSISSNNGYNLYPQELSFPLIIIFFLLGNGENQDQAYKILYENSEKQSEYHKELLHAAQARSDKVYDLFLEKEKVQVEERRAAIEREGLALDDQNECKFLNTLAETSVKFSEDNQKLFLDSVSGILDSRTKRRKMM